MYYYKINYWNQGIGGNVMNDVIETILAHRSVRSFTNTPLTKEQIKLIVKSAQAAATSSFVQAYTIIGVEDQKKKEELAVLAGNQKYVAENGYFFVFCADLYRHELAAEMEGKNGKETLESTEKFMVALIDATLAAQNAVLAAESMGLGICYIGGIRNRLPDVSKLLNLPNRVVPLFGLAVGYPTKKPGQKLRLPLEHVFQIDGYEQDKKKLIKQLENYNEQISNYYKMRTGGQRQDRWTEQIAEKLTNPTRMYMKQFLEKIKLPLK
jgi:FMN reductase (NADPH)